MRKICIIIVALSLIIFAFCSVSICEMEKKKKDDLYRQVELFSDTLAIIQTDFLMLSGTSMSMHARSYNADFFC